MNIIVGQNILHYKILEKLGEGGMGIVYKAEDTKLKREVAIKFLPQYISNNEEERKRFEIEAQAAASLNHTNITTIHSVEEIDDPQRGKDVFIVMEYIEGVELKDKIKTGTIPTDEAINLAIQIAEGLEAAHKKGIVHRDIKSGNIMIAHDNKAKIMDFGLAKIGEGIQLTKAGTTIGTVAYMSPEQTRGEDVDYRTDIWSFGVVFYEMLMGKLPFRGSYDQAIIYAILNHELKPIENISPELNLVLNKTLAKDPENRYPNIGELLNDLKQLKNDSLITNATKKHEIINKKRNTKRILYSSLLIVFLSIFIFFLPEKNPEEITSTGKKIVVLPFDNLGIAEDEYFADGITEEISARLSLIKELGVVSHTSAMYYKGTHKTIPEISRDLNVDYVLNGSVRWEKSSDEEKVKIIPRLTQVSNNIQIWAESYERQLDEIFSLQGDIATRIANALNITLNQSEKTGIENKLTENFEAYQLFLRGSDAWYFFANVTNFSHDRIELAIKFYEKAVKLDPNFSQAWARLSAAYVARYWFGFIKTPEQLALAKEAADKAIQLNPNSSESLAAMGVYYYWGLLDYDQSLKYLEKAISISTDDVKLLIFKALILRRMGDFKEAAEIIEKVLPLDPQSARNYDELGITYQFLREYDKARTNFNHSIRLSPDKFNAYAHLVQNYWLCCGDLEKSREVFNSIPIKTLEPINLHIFFELDIYDRTYRSGLNFINYMNREVFEELRFWSPSSLLRGRLYQLMGNTDSSNIEFNKAKTILENKIKESPSDYRVRMSLGLTYAGLGLYKDAIDEGKKAAELYPLSKDAIIGNIPILTLAYIYTMAGNYDEALDKIDEILSRPFDFSIAVLKIDPRFDALRSHPEYQKILKKYSK